MTSYFRDLLRRDGADTSKLDLLEQLICRELDIVRPLGRVEHAFRDRDAHWVSHTGQNGPTCHSQGPSRTQWSGSDAAHALTCLGLR